jgi:hypothetical protein
MYSHNFSTLLAPNLTKKKVRIRNTGCEGIIQFILSLIKKSFCSIGRKILNCHVYCFSDDVNESMVNQQHCFIVSHNSEFSNGKTFTLKGQSPEKMYEFFTCDGSFSLN